MAVAYRRKDLSPGAASAVAGYLRKQIGLEYDTIGAGAGGARANDFLCITLLALPGCMIVRSGLLYNPKRFYCSELVVSAFNAAGAPITDIPAAVSNPNNVVDAYSTGLLTYVGHLKS